MPSFRVNRIRWPDEFRYALNSIAENFAEHAEATEDLGTVSLTGLSAEQSLAFDIFTVVSEVDDVIDSLNLAMSDMERLAGDAKAFEDRNPFKRFQFLVRMYFYEYGRFADVFGYFTRWKQHQRLLTKEQRKAHREAFYSTFEPAIKTRNVMLHDAVSWEKQCSPEIGILQGLATIGQEVVDGSGKKLEWNAHIGPLCLRTLPLMLNMGHHMQVFWNMEMSELALSLVDAGRLTKASKPYVGPHAAMFLRADPNYR